MISCNAYCKLQYPAKGVNRDALRPNGHGSESDMPIDLLACEFKAMRLLTDEGVSFHDPDVIPIFKITKIGVLVLAHCV